MHQFPPSPAHPELNPLSSPSPVVATPTAKGKAITALVCGITGSVLGLIPILAVPALALGIVALVFGLLAAKAHKASGHSVGMARTGWILGAAAIVLGVIGFAIVQSALNDLEQDLNQLEQDLGS